MRGYATVEFMISWSLFLGVVFYMIFSVGGQIIHQYQQANTEIQNSMNYRLFYMLFFTRGVPEDWDDAETALSIGLSDSYYRINKTKLENFMSECNDNYTGMVKKIGRPFYVSVSWNGTSWQCPNRKTRQTITRTMTMDGKPAVVEVGIS